MSAISISYNDSSVPISITFDSVLFHLMVVANNIIILEDKTNYNYAALTFSFCRKKSGNFSVLNSPYFVAVFCVENFTHLWTHMKGRGQNAGSVLATDHLPPMVQTQGFSIGNSHFHKLSKLTGSHLILESLLMFPSLPLQHSSSRF